MPISSPSAFPNVRQPDQIYALNAGLRATGVRNFFAGQAAGNDSNLNDAILIGFHNYSGGVIDPKLNGSTVVGEQSYPAIVSSGISVTGPNTVFGALNAPLAQLSGANVIVGSNALSKIVSDDPLQNNLQRNVIIGVENVANAAPISTNGRTVEQSVVIGYRAAYGAVNADAALFDVVIIGDSACLNYGSLAGNLVATVVVGAQAGKTLGTTGAVSENTLLGYSCGLGLQQGAGNTLIGAGVNSSIGLVNHNTALGANISDIGFEYNVILGDAAGLSGSASSGNIILGAGSTTVADAVKTFVVESRSSVSGVSAILFGSMATGNLISGTSVQGVDRDVGGVLSRNILKLLNGVAGAVNPVGGGYFYVNAGALHWVGSAGTDTPIAPA